MLTGWLSGLYRNFGLRKRVLRGRRPGNLPLSCVQMIEPRILPAASPLIISEYLANPAGNDTNQEYVELIATETIDFSVTPYSVIWTNNGTATTNGWIAGGSLSYGFQITSGTVNAGDVVYVGGSGMAPTGTKVRTINVTNTAGDGPLGNSVATAGVLGNGGGNADSIGVFSGLISGLTSSTAPVDAIFFGTATGTAVVSGGAAGFQLPENDRYSGGKLQSTSFLAPDPASGQVTIATGTYDSTTDTWTTPRTFTNSASGTDGASAVTVISGPVNAAPVLGGPTDAVSYTAGGPATVVAPAITVGDTNNPSLVSGTVTIGSAQTGDILSFTNNPATMGNISGSFVGSVLTLTSAGGTATLAEWEAALRSVTFSNTLPTPTAGPRTLSYVVNDGLVNSNTLDFVLTVTGNQPPIFSSPATWSIVENLTLVGSVQATDFEMAPITYSIVGGADQALFTINPTTGALSFLVAPDFDVAGDAGADNTYNLTVQASDGTNNVTQDLSVSVSNLNDITPVVTLNRTIIVNPGQSVQISGAILTATDADSGPSSLVYTVTTPSTGTITKNGVAVTSFTQAEVNVNDTTANAIRYTAPGSEGNDSFVLSLSDGANTVANISITITIVPATSPVSFTGPNYAQNFDNLLPTPIPSDAQTLPSAQVLPQGWIVSESGTNADSSIQIDDGGSGTGDTYLYGIAGSNERALGSFSSGSMTSVYGLVLINNSGSTLTSFSLSYVGEQWKNGISGSALTNVLTFDYSTTATTLTDAGFTAVSPLDFAAPQGGTVGSDTPLDGNDGANRTAISSTVNGISWVPGGLLFLRWTDVNETGNDDGLALDEVTFSASGAPANLPPSFTSPAAFEVAENTTSVGSVAASDPESQTLTYLITGGADQSLFTVNSSTGALSFNSAPNFEAPLDAGANNVYDVVVQVTDGVNPVTQAILITVTNVNEAPAFTSPATFEVAENTTTIGGVVAVDPDSGATLTYSISGGADAARFSINPTTGALTFAAAPNFESPLDVGANNVYDVIVQASDGTNNVTQAIAVTVTNVNEPPTINSPATFVVSENVTAIGNVSATDPDAGAILTYSIFGGADAAAFSINSSTGALAFVTPPNYEAPTDSGANNVYNVTVQVSDGTNSVTQAVAVSVNDVDEALVITSPAAFSIPENSTAIGNVVAVDPENQPILCTINGGADAAFFSINGTTGALTFLAPRNFEAPADAGANNVYDVIVRASDGSFQIDQAIAVTITNVDEPPAFTSPNAFSVPENTTSVGQAAATDPENQSLTYSISGGLDAAAFSINPMTGALSFIAPPNFEAPTDNGTNNIYNVTIQVSDGTHQVTQAVAVTVTDVDEIPPTASFNALPAIRTTAVGVVTIQFSEGVTGLDLGDLQLTRNGGGVSLAGLTLNQVTPSQYTIDLSTVTGTGGDYTLTLVTAGSGIIDGASNPLDGNATVSWTNVQVTAFQVQNGQTQRSFVNTVSVTVAGSVNVASLLGSGRIRVMKTDLNGNNPVAVGTGNVSQVGNVITFDFGAQGVGGNKNDSNLDGFYTIEFDFDGNSSFETTRRFFRLLGDFNGDRTVNNADTLVSGLNAIDRLLARRGAGRTLSNLIVVDG